MTTRRLVVAGDDFGAAPEVNAGIVRAHRDGILTSASLMVTGDAVADAVALARANPRLGVGLHLVLAQARPAAPRATIPALARADGTLREWPVATGIYYAWLWCRRQGRDQLRRELVAQLDAFRATGLSLTHVDGHLNMHLHPLILPMLCDLAPRYGIRTMRLSHEDLGAALRWDRRAAVRKTFEGTIFSALARYARPRLKAAGIRAAERVYGMHQTGHVNEAYLVNTLAALPPGTSEIYGHPAERPPACMQRWQHGYDNAGEVAALTSPRVRDAIEANGIQLVRYDEV